MPPPPLNPQGSRAGLITAVVVLSILFVTSAIFAFYYSAESSKSQQNVVELNKKLNQYANADAQADPTVAALIDAKSDPQFAGQNVSAIQVALARLKALSTAIAGTADPKAAEAQANAMVAMASDKTMQALGVTLTPGSSLANVV